METAPKPPLVTMLWQYTNTNKPVSVIMVIAYVIFSLDLLYIIANLNPQNSIFNKTPGLVHVQSGSLNLVSVKSMQLTAFL
jgi:hypothetical protein